MEQQSQEDTKKEGDTEQGLEVGGQPQQNPHSKPLQPPQREAHPLASQHPSRTIATLQSILIFYS